MHATKIPPDSSEPRGSRTSNTLSAWSDIARQLATLLRDPSPGTAWVRQFGEAAGDLRTRAAAETDTALFVLLQAAAHDIDRYSAHHAMLCAIVCDLCACHFAWPDAERTALWHAALSMNLAMTDLQDALATQVAPLLQAQRDAIAAHAAQGSSLLSSAGVDDALWIDVVRRHHEERADTHETDVAGRLAQLLHRVDVYAAKLSRRATRTPASPAVAARDACLGPSGHPDAIGATMLRVLGLYPPGCFVELADGDLGVVIRRGEKAHTPVVSVLRAADGWLYRNPVRRDTALPAHAVVRGVQAGTVKVDFDAMRALAAR